MKRILLAIAFTLFAFPAFAACDSPMNANSPTVALSCTTTTGSKTYEVGAGCTGFENSGSVGVFIKSGTSTVTATVVTGSAAGETYIAPGKGIVLTHSAADTHFACITASGTATVYAQTGTGD